MLPFTVIWVGFMGYHAIDAARRLDFAALLGLLVAAAWFGFVSWAAFTYTFAVYYPRAFARLWNATWGWTGKRMPLPPRR